MKFMKKKLKGKITSRRFLCGMISAIPAIAIGLGLSEVAGSLISAAVTAVVSVVSYFIADTCTESGNDD